MNSGRLNTTDEQQQLVNWLERAKRKFVGASITGSGRYSVRLMDGRNIHLFETLEDAAEFTATNSRFRFTDLALEPVKPCRTVPDAYDADELRRERRERRAQLSEQA